MTTRYQILEHTYHSYCEQVAHALGKGRLQAGDLYRMWCKKGLTPCDLSIFANAGKLVEHIIELSEFSYLPLAKSLNDQDADKFLLKTPDGYDIESVRIPMKSQQTLCVSSQVGCKMGCTFCETGRMGLLRNLSVYEIVSQVFVARHILHFNIRNLVFYGYGRAI